MAEMCLDFAAFVVAGPIVCSALFLAVSMLSKKPVFFDIFYALIWEGFIGSIPGDIQISSVNHHLRSIGSDWTDYGGINAYAKASDPLGSWTVLLGLLAAFVALGAYLFRETELA